MLLFDKYQMTSFIRTHQYSKFKFTYAYRQIRVFHNFTQENSKFQNFKIPKS
jgi:hypothetical protein